MSIHKNYFAMQSAIYNLQSCEIIPLESELGNEEGCFPDNALFSTEAQFFSLQCIYPNTICCNDISP